MTGEEKNLLSKLKQGLLDGMVGSTAKCKQKLNKNNVSLTLCSYSSSIVAD